MRRLDLTSDKIMQPFDGIRGEHFFSGFHIDPCWHILDNNQHSVKFHIVGNFLVDNQLIP